MEKKRIYPEQTPANNIPYHGINSVFRYRAIVPEDDSIVMKMDANGVLYVSSVAPMVATPDATVAVSIADISATITATCDTEGAEIYYTTDGSMPTTNSNHYTGPFAVLGTETMLRVVAVKNGYVNSHECVLERAATPIVTLEDGYITATCATEGATIGYLIVGEETGQEYTGPIEAEPGSTYIFGSSGSHWLPSVYTEIVVPGLSTDFRFIAENPGSTVSLVSMKATPPSLEISTDGGDTFSEWNQNSGTYDTVTLANIGDTLIIRGINDAISGFEKDEGITNFVITGTVRADGNILSMLFGESPDEVTMTAVNEYAFSYMFQGCTGLTAAPSLPATTLAQSCYSYMFYSCTGLTSAIVLAESWDIVNSGMWLYGVSGLGSFSKPKSTDIPYGNGGIPIGWTVIDL